MGAGIPRADDPRWRRAAPGIRGVVGIWIEGCVVREVEDGDSFFFGLVNRVGSVRESFW